jgi:hypothetical protein
MFFFFCLIGVAAAGCVLQAQSRCYAFSTTTGVALDAAVRTSGTQVLFASNDDTPSALLTLPFTFLFAGTPSLL